jgi:hypothetical protein
MNATLEEDILNIIENFKDKVNPEFTADSQDLIKIKRLIQRHPCGRRNSESDGLMYYQVDYDALKKHKVKDFKFSLEDYKKWQIETLETLKQQFIARRNNYASKRETTTIIQLPIE